MTQSDNISIIDMDKETDVQKSIKTKQTKILIHSQTARKWA